MWLYVRVQDPEAYYRDGPDSHAAKVKARLEEVSGERCLIVPYREFGLSAVEELRPRAIVMSGFGGRWQSYKVEWFLGMDEVLHGVDLPILCICGSHQLLGFSFSLNLRSTPLLEDQLMRRLQPDEDFPRRARSGPDEELSHYYLADGFFPIFRVAEDPLFAGLPERMIMRCSHYCEVKELPSGFQLLASSGHCRIEAMRHVSRPLYGIQFHAEAYEEPFLDGRKLLANFATIVEGFWRGSR